MPQEVGEIERLLDLLEEHLDLPAAVVEVGHAGGRPFHVVGEELHLAFLPVHDDQGAHPAHPLGILSLVGPLALEDDLLVGQDLRTGRHLPALDHPETQEKKEGRDR